MVDRAILDVNGVRISKPGIDVETAGEADMLLDSNTKMLQVIDSGSFIDVPQNQTRTVILPDLDFIPFVYIYPLAGYVYIDEYLSSSVIVRSGTAGLWSAYWAILNIPRG